MSKLYTIFFNKNLGMSQRYTGFTLSEVLIVLGTIAIIASMTIPNLIQEKQEQETVSKLKKAYSTLSNAFTLAVQENGDPTNWNLGALSSDEGGENILAIFSPFLQINQNCGKYGNCFPKDVLYKLLNNNDWGPISNMTSIAKIRLSDGILFGFFSYGGIVSKGSSPALKNVFADVYVDINGDKKPNQFGIDTFLFYLTRYGVVPYGTNDIYHFNYACKLGRNSLGLGCTAWVIYNENMDYLHCDDLSWTGKKTCD